MLICLNPYCSSMGKSPVDFVDDICPHCRMPLHRKQELIWLTTDEAKALVTELGKTFIDRDNPLCNEVLTKLINFVK